MRALIQTGITAFALVPVAAFGFWFGVRIPVKVISDSGLNVISDSGQSGHRSERSDAGVGL